MIDINDFESWAQGFRCYEQLRVVDDMSYSRSWAQAYGCYEQLNVVDGVNDSRSHEHTPLMTNSGLRMTLMILGPKPMALNAMNSLELWLTWMTLGHDLKLRAMLDMKNLVCEPKALDAMKSSGLWMTWNSIGLWMIWKILDHVSLGP